MAIEDTHLFFNKTLANYFVLHTKLYRYQWYAKGSAGYTLRSTLQQFQRRIQQDLEKLAEHILFLDGKPFATMVKFIKETTLNEATADDETDEIIDQLHEDLHKLIHDFKENGTYIVLQDDDFYSLQVINELLYNLHQMQTTCKLLMR